MRPSRVQTFLKVAEAFALRSTCTRGHVGAVIVKDNHIISCGYNGAPPGLPQCDEVGCDELVVGEPPEMIHLGCQRAIHAEANAIAWAARYSGGLLGASLYSTHEPCAKCADLIISSGIKTVYFVAPYRRGATERLQQAGIRTIWANPLGPEPEVAGWDKESDVEG